MVFWLPKLGIPQRKPLEGTIFILLPPSMALPFDPFTDPATVLTTGLSGVHLLQCGLGAHLGPGAIESGKRPGK